MRDDRVMLPDGTEDDRRRLTLGDFAAALSKRSRTIWGTVIVFVLLGMAYLYLATPQYTVTTTITASQSTDKNATSGLSALGGLAGFLGGGSSTPVAPFDLFMQMITSPRAAQRLIDTDPTVLQTIYRGEWNAQTKTWHRPGGITSLVSGAVYGLFGLPSYSPPSAQRLSTWLTNNLTVVPLGTTTSLQSISLTFYDPQFAGRLLANLRAQCDAIIREEAQQRTDKQIAFLESKLNTTQEIDYRTTLLAILSSQVTTRMTINSNLPYAASIVQPAVSSALPTSPNPYIIIGGAIVGGLLVGVFLALISAVIWPEGFHTSRVAQTRLGGAMRSMGRRFSAATGGLRRERPYGEG